MRDSARHVKGSFNRDNMEIFLLLFVILCTIYSIGRHYEEGYPVRTITATRVVQ
jgi:hypothetical protein